MFDVNKYVNDLITECKESFGERLLYVGLQGSYLRGEAKESSDIDIMVIIDDFSIYDMDEYRNILEEIGYTEKSCGFICGRNEMTKWNPQEICQLYHTTKDLFGKLSDYLPEATRKDEIDYVKISLGNLYHEFCHRYIHGGREKSIQKFRGSCKAIFFLLQNLHYLESGNFVLTKKNLKEALSEKDRQILMMSELPDDYDFDTAFNETIQWCQEVFDRIDRIS